MSTDPKAAAIRLLHAQAEVEQARLERDRLGIDIGNEPLPIQQATYLAALARLRALEMADAIAIAVGVADALDALGPLEAQP